MRRITWQVRQTLDVIGWQGMLGIALLTAGLLIAAAIPSRLAGLEQAHGEVDTLRKRLQLAAPNAGRSGGSRSEQLANFYAFFPALVTLPDWLERIYAAAEKNGVQLDTGEYKLLQERNQKLVRYQLTLPVRGNYAQVRGFIAEVLTAVPAAALDEIGFRRDSVGATALEARIRFTLYMGQV